MDLGQRIRAARLEAGLSQRQLCGDEITRNMLSLIENGTAKPSMNTLRYLASRLNKPLSFFLEEEAPAAENLSRDFIRLRSACQALEEGKDILARQLLDQVTTDAEDLKRRKLLLSARLPGANLRQICRELPSLDEELLLRAQAALDLGEELRCQRWLEAAEDQHSPLRQFLWGRLMLHRREYAAAAASFRSAEPDMPETVIPLLEQCYRELGEYKLAYEYACRQKK